MLSNLNIKDIFNKLLLRPIKWYKINQLLKKNSNNISQLHHLEKTIQIRDKIAQLLLKNKLNKNLSTEILNSYDLRSSHWLVFFPNDDILKRQLLYVYNNNNCYLKMPKNYDLNQEVKAKYEKGSKKNKVEALVLSGGGAKGIAYAGVISALDSKKKLENIDFVAGTSAGSIVSMALGLGYSSKEIKTIIEETPFPLFLAESTIYNYSNLKKWISSKISGELVDFNDLIKDVDTFKEVLYESYVFVYAYSRAIKDIHSSNKVKSNNAINKLISSEDPLNNDYMKISRFSSKFFYDDILNGQYYRLFAKKSQYILRNRKLLEEIYGFDILETFYQKKS